MKWFTSAAASAALDEPRLLKMEKLETSSVVAAAASAVGDADGDDDDDEDDYGPTSLAPSLARRPFDLEAASGSKSLDFYDVNTLESKARMGVRGKKSALVSGRVDKGKESTACAMKQAGIFEISKPCFPTTRMTFNQTEVSICG